MLHVGWARVILGVVFLEGALIFGALAFVPSYLHNRFGLSLTVAGALMAFFGVGGLSYIFAARYFLRHFGESGLAGGGGVTIGGAWLLLAAASSWSWAIPACYLVGIGFYMLHNTLQTNATQMAPQVRGTAVSLFASLFFLGQSLGVVLAAAVFDRFGITVLLVLTAILLPLLALAFARLVFRHHQQARRAAAGA